MSSDAYSFDKEDVVKLFHLAIQLYGPAILVLISQLEDGDVDFRYIGALTLTLTLAAIQRYIQGQVSPKA